MNPALPKNPLSHKKGMHIMKKYSTDLAKLKLRFGITKKGRAG